MIQIVVGTETNQKLAERVLEYSMRLGTSEEIDLRVVHQNESRVGGTNFGFVRFHVPQIFNYSGKAIYQDADQLVLTDIRNLVDELDSDHTFAMVNKPEGYFGGKPVPVHNQTSVMVMDCEKLKTWDPNTLFDHVVPNRGEKGEGQIHYRDFMTLSWFDQNQIKAIDPRWNHFNIVKPDSRIIHFSHVRSQPWVNAKHPLTEFWGEWLQRAISEGFVSRATVVAEVARRHVAPHVLKFVPLRLKPFRKYEYAPAQP